jgi:hypothetical protein
LITTLKYQLAGSAIANRNTCAKAAHRPKSIVASMSPTTQQREHSPYRRRKSMLFVGPRNMKVIVFGRTNVALTQAFAAYGRHFQGNP